MIHAGVAGFKCFLIHSGVDEFPHVTDCDLHAAMKQLQGTGSVLLVTHQPQHPLHVPHTSVTSFTWSPPSFMQSWMFSRQRTRLVVRIILQRTIDNLAAILTLLRYQSVFLSKDAAC